MSFLFLLKFVIFLFWFVLIDCLIHDNTYQRTGNSYFDFEKISKRKFALFILVLLVLDKLSPLFLCHVVDSVDQMIPMFLFACFQNRRNNARIHKAVAQ